jgi:oligopeptide transport system substrate-binding protein
MRRYAACIALLAGLAALWFCSCSGSGEPNPEQTFIMNLTAEPESLDPVIMTGLHDAIVALQMFEGLVNIDPVNLQPSPGIATSWDRSSDGFRYTFHLRKSKWSDGSPLTAQDFVQSWERALNKRTASQYADLLFYLKNGKRYHEGKIRDFAEVGVKALDDYTLQVQLQRITPFFLYLAAFHTYMPTQKKATDTGFNWTQPETMVCNGPFMLKEHRQNSAIVLVPNPHYYDADSVKLKKVIIYTTDNLDTCVRMYEAGETHWIRDIPQGHIDRMSQRPDFHSTSLWATMFLDFNVKIKPLDDERVRKALSLAIDREQLVKAVTRAGEKPTNNLVPTGFPGWHSPPEEKLFDLLTARRLLAAAGYADRKNFPQLKILVDQQDVHVQIVEALQAMWKQNLGLEFIIIKRDWKTYLKDLRTLNYHIARARWYGDFFDPVTFLGMWGTDNGNNLTGYSHNKYDNAIEQAAWELDEETRLSKLMAAENRLVRTDRPIAPLYNLVSRDMLSPRVKNFRFNKLSLHPLKDVYLEPASP